MKRPGLLAGALLLATCPAPAQAAERASTACEVLKSAPLREGRITGAEGQPPGRINFPLGGQPVPDIELPAFCRVTATLTPSPDSDIRMEVWLPDRGWNGKFLMVGNGGWSGSISYPALAAALARGYAAASTDRGHEGRRGTFALAHPEKLRDFAWRSTHLTADHAKHLIAVFYRRPPRLSYFSGCSSGGGQALKEAQEFPADFDGIIAGAPANNWIRLHAQSLWTNQVNLPPGRPPILQARQFALLHDKVITACDRLDGLQDGEIADPRRCRPAVRSLLCQPAQADGQCLSLAQVVAAEKIYAAPINPHTRRPIFPGMVPGSELMWGLITTAPWMTATDTFRLAFADPEWTYLDLDLSRDVDAAERSSVAQLAAVDPDLSAFRARGGKLILYHGWGDGGISPLNSISYYERVSERSGGIAAARSFARLFMVPAMGHCRGAYNVNWIEALEKWVEGGQAPDRLTAIPVSAPPPGDTPGRPLEASELQPPGPGIRPVCAYPAGARYSGSGDTSDPGSFGCRVTRR